MSDKCGNCDCSDSSKCVKKGSSYSLVISSSPVIIGTEKSYMDGVVMDGPAAEHGGKCKCGPSCSCTNCTCGP